MPKTKAKKSFPRSSYSRKTKAKNKEAEEISSPLQNDNKIDKGLFNISEDSSIENLAFDLTEDSQPRELQPHILAQKPETPISELNVSAQDSESNHIAQIRRYNIAVPNLTVAKLVEFHLRGIRLSKGEEILKRKALNSPEVILEESGFDKKIAKIFPLGVASHRGKILAISPFAKKSLPNATKIEPPLVDTFFRDAFQSGEWYTKNKTAFFVLKDNGSFFKNSSTSEDDEPDSEISSDEGVGINRLRNEKFTHLDPFQCDKDIKRGVQTKNRIFDTLSKLSIEKIDKLTHLGFDPSNISNNGRYDEVFKKRRRSSLLEVSQPTNFTMFTEEGKMKQAQLPIKTLIDPQSYLSQIPLVVPKSFEKLNKRGNRYMSHIQCHANAEIFARLVEIFKIYTKLHTPILDSFTNFSIAEASETNKYIISMLTYTNSVFRDLILAHTENINAGKIRNNNEKISQVYSILTKLNKKLPIDNQLLGDLGTSSIFSNAADNNLESIEFFKTPRVRHRFNNRRQRGTKRKNFQRTKTHENSAPKPKRRKRNKKYKLKQKNKKVFTTPEKLTTKTI